MGTRTDYHSWTVIRLLESLWQDYGKQVRVDGKGRLQLVARDYPAVPVEMHQAIKDKQGQIRALMALEAREKPIESLVSGGQPDGDG